MLNKIRNAQLAQEALDMALLELKERSLTIEEYNVYYWETDFKLSFVDLNDKRATTEIIEPRILEFKCTKCGESHPIKVTSRSKRDEVKRTFICDLCKQHIEEVKRASEEKKQEENNILREQRQAYINKLKSMPYKEYLLTEHWQKVRKRALSRAGFKCQLCNSKEHLHVHHRTYINKGNEKNDDLIVLCETCHAKQHDKVANNDR